MKAYKGFDENLKCKDFQYEIGKTYEEPEAQLCEKCFHACEYPLDVFCYYSPAKGRFAEVKLDDVSDEKSDDYQLCGKKICVKAEIGIAGIVKASIDYIKEHATSAHDENGDFSAATNTGYGSAATNTGNFSAATNIGYRSAATNTGDRSAATNTGYRSAATNTGDRSAATNTGDFSAATNTGYDSAATNTGDFSAATNTGYRSAATNTGDRSAATNTGYRSAATNTGKEGVASSLGIEGKAKGALGCWLVLAEWEEVNGEWRRTDVQCRRVDGETVKSDTFYRLENGEFVEASDDE
jgi:hypothetical protein